MAVMALMATAAGGSPVTPTSTLRSCYVPSIPSNATSPPSKTPRSISFADSWSDHKGRSKPLAEVKRYSVTPEWCWRSGGYPKAAYAGLDFGEYDGEWYLLRDP